MSKTALPYGVARDRADALVLDLQPFCERIEIAGSLRRQSTTVGDLELVAIPRYEAAGLFGDQQQNALWAYLNTSVALRYTFLKGNNPDGRYFQVALEDGMQVDIFTADAAAFGWIYLIRTGSADFSRSVLTEWKRQRSLGKDQKGSVDGHLVDRYGTVYETPEEQDVFNLLGIPFIDPRDRTDDALWRVRRGQLPPR